MATARIGISGWRYAPWRGVFYPKGLPQRLELSYAASLFAAIEINGSRSKSVSVNVLIVATPVLRRLKAEHPAGGSPRQDWKLLPGRLFPGMTSNG